MIAFADRVKERATVSGANPYVLAGAVAGHRSFAQGFASDTECHYCAEFGITWEVGIGQLETGTGQIVRKKVLSTSDNSTSITWPNGSNVQISCVASASAIQAGFMQGVKVAMPGNLKVMTGTAKWYAPQTTVLTTIDAWVGVQSTGSDVKFNLIKNGASTVASVTVASASSTLQEMQLAIWWDTLANVRAAMNDDNNFDGQAVVAGQLYLLMDYTGVNFASDIYTVGGVAGDWTLTRISPVSIAGKQIKSLYGTYANKIWEYNGTNGWFEITPSNQPRTVAAFNPILVLNPGDWLSMNVTQVGSITPGSDLNVRLT